MKTKHIYLLGLSVLFMGTGCINTHYELSTITRTRLVVDHRYDASPDVDAQLFMANYKHHVDSVMVSLRNAIIASAVVTPHDSA